MSIDDAKVPAEDVRKLVRLFRDAREHAKSGANADEFSLRGICYLIEADIGVLFLDDEVLGEWYANDRPLNLVPPTREAPTDDMLLVQLEPAADGCVQGAIFTRQPGAAPFGKRERDLAQLWLEQSGIFEGERPVANSAPPLTPRERETIELLLRGLSEKEVATTLALSTSTVQEYVKDAYKKLGISRRSELFEHFARR